MGVTLLELYEDTKDKFKLEILAGKERLDNEVSRVYYIEDIYISNWTRKGELIMSTVMSGKEDGWLRKFIDSLIPYEPSGIIINLGGYISEIPEDVIEYCEKIGFPLVIFPWEIFLQDVIQEFTNKIFKKEQLKSNVSAAFLNAIYSPENKLEYKTCLERNGYQDISKFIVASIYIDKQNYKEKVEFMNRKLRKYNENIVGIIQENEIIYIFCDVIIDKIHNILENLVYEFKKIRKYGDVFLGIGSEENTFFEVYKSYKKAYECKNYAKKNKVEMIFFQDLGVKAILFTSEKTLLKQYENNKLGVLISYDIENKSDYINTLESYIKNGGNIHKVSKELFLHRNTVSYRIQKIKQLLGNDLTSMEDFVEYQVAFYIRSME